jgi:hypothetical protein
MCSSKKVSLKVHSKTTHCQFESMVPRSPSQFAQIHPGWIPTATRTSENSYKDDNDSSSGQALYMSSCTNSYGFFDDNVINE